MGPPAIFSCVLPALKVPVPPTSVIMGALMVRLPLTLRWAMPPTRRATAPSQLAFSEPLHYGSNGPRHGDRFGARHDFAAVFAGEMDAHGSRRGTRRAADVFAQILQESGADRANRWWFARSHRRSVARHWRASSDCHQS